jgi:predicted DsbA family dithiol-disulfide isomerase
MGAVDDRVRLAIANAAMREGQKIGRWEVAVAVAVKAAGLDAVKLLALAQSSKIAAKTQATTAEFDSLQINQRPAFLIENSIGDRAVFSGIAKPEPLTATIDAMLTDEAAYTSWKSHFGDPPPR